MSNDMKSEKSGDDRLKWWRDARFGMFIHWGLYSEPAGEWKGKEIGGLSEWIMRQAKIPLAEYAKLAETFNPVDFDADFIAKLAKDAGMKYLVITAKHHDGFAMYHSKVDKYNIVDATPFKRDPIAELAKACAKHGLVFCVYYSQDLDWAHPDGGGNDWDFDPAKKKFERYFEEKCIPQLRELLTNYGRVGLIWFDMATNITTEQSRRIREFVHELQPDCLVSGRVGHGMGDYGSLGDNQMPLGTPAGDWETPGTLNSSWGFKASDHKWRKPEEIIGAIADLANKGVNYLLNIGPDARGRVPEPSVNTLQTVGKWMSINGEAIYGTSPNPFNCEFDWGRVTVKGENIYLLFSGWPKKVFTLVGLDNQVVSVTLLGEKPKLLEFSRGSENGTPVIRIQLPETSPSSYVAVVRIACVGKPNVLQEPCQQEDGALSLPAHKGIVHRHSNPEVSRKKIAFGGALMAAMAAETNNEIDNGAAMGVGPSGVTENWYSPEDYMSWDCRVIQPGEYEVQIRTMAKKYEPWKGGHDVEVRVGDQILSETIKDDGRMNSLRNYHFEEAFTRLGTVRIDKPGTLEVVLKARNIKEDVDHGLCLSTLRLSHVTGV